MLKAAEPLGWTIASVFESSTKAETTVSAVAGTEKSAASDVGRAEAPPSLDPCFSACHFV